MFTWNIARSAEALFSRWAVKRLCKFMLKKKLGQFILGDLDLDQLDVQLTHGTIQLTDLALNVDYLNDKLGAAASVMVKEGSIGSLSVKMPWKGKGFQVELDELELVLAPCSNCNSRTGGESTSSCSKDGNQRVQRDGATRYGEENFGDNGAKYGFTASADVHEGVMTIAKMVKWFVTSFHVKVRKLIVAFEPNVKMDMEEKKVGHQRTLVLRVSEIECGTCVSEDVKVNSDAKIESILGMSQLTSFVNFNGAVLELLELGDIDKLSCSLGLSGELFSGDCTVNAATPVMTGKKGGFSGNLKLSIPWKNGSLDIGKVDADVCVDPIELRAQPSTIKWFLLSWENLKNMNKDGRGSMPSKSAESVYSNSASDFHSPISFPATVAPAKVDSSFSPALSSPSKQDSVHEAALPGTHFIPDWVPNSVKENEKGDIQELDLGASVDQFFECLDVMRNTQSVLGSSGMWNLTHSVVSALTATSSLASGSLHIPSEQQHVQTNLNSTLARISIILSLQDEHEGCKYDPGSDHSTADTDVHYLCVECEDIFVGLQVCPQEMRFRGTMKYIEVADYSCASENIFHTFSVQQLQAKVLDSLPPFASTVKDSVPQGSSVSVLSNFSAGNLIKIKLMSTSDVTHCQFIANYNSTDGSLARPTLFSLKLPQFLFWVSFSSIDVLFKILKDIGKSVEMSDRVNELPFAYDKHEPSQSNMKKSSSSGGRMPSSREKFRGDISILNARLILCFPFESCKDVGGCFPWDQFIAIDFSSPSTSENGKHENSSPISGASSRKQCTLKDTCSLHFNIGDLKMYLVSPSCKNDAGISSSGMARQNFCSVKMLSVSNRGGGRPTISLIWPEGPVTGPWIAERAKSMAILEESNCRHKLAAKGYEFVTVSAVKNLDDMNSQARDEMILSSSSLLHINLFDIAINLDSSRYVILHDLFNQMINRISDMTQNAVSVMEISCVSQSSILLECQSLEILIRPDIKLDMKSSVQTELSGSWNCFKLRVQEFSILSVSNIGGIRGAEFFWVAHGEGKLWGSVTGLTEQEFLLISCSNSTRKRGDGCGSNVLSSSFAGSDIINLRDPERVSNLTSVIVRCGTMIAIGGRLDWLDSISSFFILPSSEIHDKKASNTLSTVPNAPCRHSFVLKLLDIGLCYEPYSDNLASRSHHSESTSSFKEGSNDHNVACLLAASSFTLSNSTLEDSVDNDYKIRVQDLGLLLCAACVNLGGTYDVEYLREMGYVKVAQEALIEAILRTNCMNGLLWELECLKSHICIDTCHDTTSGLMRLAAQLQQLFAPNLEELVVHLQHRWNSVNHAQGRSQFNDGLANYHDSSSSTSQEYPSTVGISSKSGVSAVAGLMDEICEDAFHLDEYLVCHHDSNESHVVLLNDCLLGEACSSTVETPDIFSDDISFVGSIPPVDLESSQALFQQNGSIPDLIEGYCISDLQPLSELSMESKSLSENPKCRSRNHRDENLGRGNGGWYEDFHLRIDEDHISEAKGAATTNRFLKDNPPSIDSASSDDFGKATGRIIFMNIDIVWSLYGGCDWRASNDEPSSNGCGRDATTCLELALSGMQFQYYFFPVGKINVSKLLLSVQDIYLSDRSKNAPWKRVFGHYSSKDHPRESSSKAFELCLEAVRPDPLIPLEEYRLSTGFLPMLLHLHQSQLDFLISFFGAKKSSAGHSSDHPGAKPSATSSACAGHTIADEALLPYFQKFDMGPILLRVDYHPSHVDLAALRGGKYVELVNLVPWKGVELQLKHVHGVGVYGWGSICETVVGEWLEDISQNQMHKILQGLPTIRSLVAVGTGATKLVSLPVESYRKDQRIVKGMQRGTIAFLRSISLEAVGLGVHLAAGAHDILLQAEYILSTVPPVSWPVQNKTKPNIRCNQPKDAKQGIQQACESLSDGLGKSASALVRMPLKKYQRGASAGSALATAVRAVPAAAIAPVSACAGAAHYALLGLRNSLDPDRKKESIEKYMDPKGPRDWR